MLLTSLTVPEASRGRQAARRCSGFSLVEVMVALVVTSVGLLGLAKMESLALASTNVAGARAIAAIEASSLAAAMHADPGYWAAGHAPLNTTVYYDTTDTLQIVESTATGLATPVAACATAGAASCGTTALAAYDLQTWASDLKSVLSAPFSTIACTTTAGVPVTCTITIQWAEGAVAADSQSQTNATALSAATRPTYTLTVQP